MPPDGAERFVAALKPLYGKQSDRLVVNLYPKTPHAFTPPMWQASLEWFDKWLTK